MLDRKPGARVSHFFFAIIQYYSTKEHAKNIKTKLAKNSAEFKRELFSVKSFR